MRLGPALFSPSRWTTLSFVLVNGRGLYFRFFGGEHFFKKRLEVAAHVYLASTGGKRTVTIQQHVLGKSLVSVFLGDFFPLPFSV